MYNMETHTVTFTDECMDAAFGYENHDGYVRILDKPKKQGGRLVMRHRWFWEQFVGHIPDGHEINHKCKNRRCFNPRHLETLDGSEHTILTNRERYKLDKEFGQFMLDHGVRIKDVAEYFGRSRSCIQNWSADRAQIH